MWEESVRGQLHTIFFREHSVETEVGNSEEMLCPLSNFNLLICYVYFYSINLRIRQLLITSKIKG